MILSSIGERSSSTTSLLKVDETSTARDMEVSAEKTNNGNKIKTEIGVTGDKHQSKAKMELKLPTIFTF